MLEVRDSTLLLQNPATPPRRRKRPDSVDEPTPKAGRRSATGHVVQRPSGNEVLVGRRWGEVLGEVLWQLSMGEIGSASWFWGLSWGVQRLLSSTEGLSSSVESALEGPCLAKHVISLAMWIWNLQNVLESLFMNSQTSLVIALFFALLGNLLSSWASRARSCASSA